MHEAEARGLGDIGGLRKDLVAALGAAGFGQRTVDDVQLLVSELVANALSHGGSTATVRASRAGRIVVVEVDDDSSEMPTVLMGEPKRVGGNGLHLVDVIASAWGAIARPHGGKTVWFQIDAD